MTDLAAALAQAYDGITTAVEQGGEPDFARPTRAAAWTVKELLCHLSIDAVRGLAACAGPVDAEPDVDAVTYWRPFRPTEGDGGAAHARFVQVSASAYGRSRSLVEWWRMVSTGAAQAAATADPAARVRTQGHVLGVPDLVSTLLVEATVHHLDLTVDLVGAPPPTRAGLAETRRVLEGLAGAPLPDSWDDLEATLKATGRVDLTDADRSLLRDRAAALPLLG